MAESKKVTGNDVIQKDFLSNAIANAEKFRDVILKTEEAIVALNKEQTKHLANAKKGESVADIKKQNELLDKAAKSRKLLAETKKLEAEATLAVTKAKAAESAQEKKTQAETAKTIKLLEQENSAYAKKSKQLQELRKQYRDLALGEKKSAEETKKLKAEINALDKELKQVDADMGVFSRNVGDYKNQMTDALKSTDLFSAGLGKLDNNTKAIVAGFGGILEQLKKVRQAEDAASDGASKFSKTLKAAGIGVLIAAIGALFSFFTSSREGALEFDLALNKVKGTLDVILGSLSKLGSGIVDGFKAIVLQVEAAKLKFSLFAKDRAEGAKKQAEADKLAASATEKLTTAFDGNFAAIENQIAGYDELTKAIFAYEDQLRLLQIAQAKVNMDEEDFNEIASDTTISLNEQKAALEGAIKSRLESAKIGKQIGDTELALAGKQLELELRKNKVSEADIALLKEQGFQTISSSKLSIKASTEAINAVQEKYLAQLAAADKLDDLDRQEAERRRQIAQTEIINDVELIRSKKLGADAQVQILTKQVADEKIQLEERERLNDELRQKQLDAQNAEIKILAKLKTSRGQQAVSEAELNDLIATKDAVVLAGKLKLLRATKLSEEATTEVAKVVFEAQTNEIANQDRIAKFEEEKLERLEKIRKLDQEIAIIQQNTQLQALAEVSANKAEKERLANELVFRNENVFNRNLVSLAQQASNERIAIAEEEARVKRELLDKQYQIEKENIEKSVTDEQLKAKELEKLAATYNQNVAKLASERVKTTDDINKQIAERQNQILVKQTQLVADNLNKTAQAFTDALDQRYAQQSDQQQRQIDKTNANIAKQQDLAQRGQKNQLAFEESQLAKQQLAQQDAAKKQAKIQERIQTAEALLNAYNAELQQPNATPLTAGPRAIADVLLFKGLAKGLVQFAVDGNDNVQAAPGQYAPKGKDSIPFLLAPEEGVVTAKANKGNPGAVKALNDGTFKQLFTPKIPSVDTGSTAQNMANSLSLQSLSKVESLLEDISNKPNSNLSADSLGNIVETIVQKRIKKTITHKRPRI